MSHEIFANDTAAFTGRPAWHQLGDTIPTEVARTQTCVQYVQAARGDWPVEMFEIFAEVMVAGPDGMPVVERIPLDDFRALVRMDDLTPLHVHGKGYTPSPNIELPEYLDAINEAAHDGRVLDPDAWVTMKGGRVLAMTGKFRDPITLPGGDVIEPYVVSSNAHNASQSSRTRSNMFRVVCRNTHLASMMAKVRVDISIRHTRNRAERVEVAKRDLAALEIGRASCRERV